jgi:hypothetical protein
MGARSQNPASQASDQTSSPDGVPPFRLQDHPYLAPSGAAPV